MANQAGKLHFLTLFLYVNKSSHVTILCTLQVREPSVEWSYIQFQTHVLPTISYYICHSYLKPHQCIAINSYLLSIH